MGEIDFLHQKKKKKKKRGRDGIQVNRRKDRNFGVKWPKLPIKTLGFRKNN